MLVVQVRSGGCSCGAVRYETVGEPIRVSVCHCKQCQLRTGSAFGISCYFPKESVKVLQGSMKTYQRRSDDGRWFRTQFCGVCGSTVLWHLEALPEAIGVAGGSFDNTDWLDPKLHVWASSAQKWIHFPEGVEVLRESNIGKR
jgi:hypothetical protein